MYEWQLDYADSSHISQFISKYWDLYTEIVCHRSGIVTNFDHEALKPLELVYGRNLEMFKDVG